MSQSLDRHALLHLTDSQMAYIYDRNTLHLRLRTRARDCDSVTLRIGDPFLWEYGGLDGGNLGGANASGWIGARSVEMSLESRDSEFDTWWAEVRPENRRSRYAFILQRKKRRWLFGEKRCLRLTRKNEEAALQELSNFFCHPYLHASEAPDIPEWARQTVWYQIFPDRFCNGDPSLDPPDVLPWHSEEIHSSYVYTGGDIAGIRQKLDYLETLGVNGLYFCPMFTAATNHRYDTVDYFTIDPKLGTNEDFRQLVQEAHERGMKIMVDAVFNHLGDQSPQWQDVLKHGHQSRYADWFHLHPSKPGEPLRYETFGCVPEMPKLNTAHPECRQFLLDAARFWIEDMDCDAWRLDVANEVDATFWRDFRRVVKTAKPDSYILGEIWHNAMPWLRGDQFDSVMNYPLYDAIVDHLILGRLDREQFVAAINQSLIAYPRPVSEAAFNLLESHDTSRIMGLAGGDEARVRMAYALLFFCPGSPCIFQGGEFGLDGLKAHMIEWHREAMPWERPERQNLTLFRFLQQLIRLRLSSPELSEVPMRWLDSLPDKIFAVSKAGHILLCNPGPRTQVPRKRLPKGKLLDVLNQSELPSGKPLKMKAGSVLWLKVQIT